MRVTRLMYSQLPMSSTRPNAGTCAKRGMSQSAARIVVPVAVRVVTVVCALCVYWWGIAAFVDFAVLLLLPVLVLVLVLLFFVAGEAS